MDFCPCSFPIIAAVVLSMLVDESLCCSVHMNTEEKRRQRMERRE